VHQLPEAVAEVVVLKYYQVLLVLAAQAGVAQVL
jgi:hypothetical protein